MPGDERVYAGQIPRQVGWRHLGQNLAAPRHQLPIVGEVALDNLILRQFILPGGGKAGQVGDGSSDGWLGHRGLTFTQGK